MLGGSALAVIANSLLATLAPDTSTGKWIGYQILLGVGRGLCMQMVHIPLLHFFSFFFNKDIASNQYM